MGLFVLWPIPPFRPQALKKKLPARLHVASDCQDGPNILDFKMKPETPFEAVLKAWCDLASEYGHVTRM